MKVNSNILILLLMLISSNAFSQFKGAYLSSELNEENLTVNLDVYYDCNFADSPDFEYVALFETLIKSSKQYLKLSKNGAGKQTNSVSAPCKNLNTCFSVVKYTGTLKNLNKLPGGYELTWSKCCLTNDFMNVQSDKEFGISLQNKINEFEYDEGNVPPVLLQLPFLSGCAKYENNIFFNVIDSTDGDRITIKSGSIFSNNSVEDKVGQLQKGPEGITGISSPPYLPVQYASDFDNSKVFGHAGNFSINDTTKIIYWKSQQAGKYLIKLNLEESRKNQKINSSQVIFITELN